MKTPLHAWLVPLALLLPVRAPAQAAAEPIVYTISAPAPQTHVARIEAVYPTGGRDAVELMMATWSPGFYRVENHAARVQELRARDPDGAERAVERPRDNRWRIATAGASRIVVTYELLCQGRSVTTNWVDADYAVFNGPATYLGLAGALARPHEVRLDLPPAWPQSATSLRRAEGGGPHRFIAPDFDVLLDSPIVAGRLSVHEFDVDGSRHDLVDFGAVGAWDGAVAARHLQQLVAEHARFIGKLPFERYVFLNAFRPGGGGLEHLDSTLLTSSASPPTPTARWLAFVSHEYFHAFNVKRLRPVELGPFDYEQPPQTASLWVAEGLTTYYGDLAVVRAGLGTQGDFLAGMSSHIRQLQGTPGRLVQSLEQASLSVWTGSTSGVGGNRRTTVSYYVKGPVAGFLLDARIRRLTDDARSLDDAMRLAYARYSGARGFTPDEFRSTAAEVAGADLSEFFRRTVASAEELDYTEALEWWGLRFAPEPPDGKQAWTLEVLPDATAAQRQHLQALLSPTPARRRGRSRPGPGTARLLARVRRAA
jgi:predicted metalloprotease with PDZ domain